VLAERVYFQQSECTLNTSLSNINASDTDIIVNNYNTLPADQAMLPEDNHDPSLTND
jgi:hypothetical protein